MKTVDPLESVNVAKRDSVQTTEQAERVFAYHVEHRPDGGYFVSARHWDANKTGAKGARVTELLKGRVVQVGHTDEEVLLLFPSIVESRLDEKIIARKGYDDLLAALREIAAITDEDAGTFRKRGGTYRGLISVIASAALAKAEGRDES